MRNTCSIINQLTISWLLWDEWWIHLLYQIGWQSDALKHHVMQGIHSWLQVQYHLLQPFSKSPNPLLPNRQSCIRASHHGNRIRGFGQSKRFDCGNSIVDTRVHSFISGSLSHAWSSYYGDPSLPKKILPPSFQYRSHRHPFERSCEESQLQL